MLITKTEQGTKKTGTRKSVKLDRSERVALKKTMKQYDRKEDAATAFDMSRGALTRIDELGRGSEENILKIRKKLSEAA